MDRSTSLFTVISSAHGRLRRGQRNIGKRDLQAAVKYGKKEPGYPDRNTGELRWKYTYADVVYITDSTSRREVTSYVLPLPITKEPVSKEIKVQHDMAVASIGSNPANVASHTIIVVDHSSSMKEADVAEFRSRIDAVYSTLALEFIEAQLLNGTAGSRDLVSLVAMGSSSRIVFEAQPVDWILFNRFLDLREQSRKKIGALKGHGNYLPALQQAEFLMSRFANGNCALMLMFLSDGKPSDCVPLGSGSIESKHVQMMIPFIERMTAQYGRRLTVHTIGFANREDFGVLRAMADEASIMSKGAFHFGHTNLEAVLTTTASSLVATKSEMTDVHGSAQRTVRSVTREARDHRLYDPFSFHSLQHDYDIFMSPNVKRQEYSEKEKAWREVPLVSANARGIAVRKKVFGEGAERFVRLMTEIDEFKYPVGSHLVAKESRYEDSYLVENKHRRFHTIYVKTREKSAQIAERFNRQLRKVVGVSKPTTVSIGCNRSGAEGQASTLESRSQQAPAFPLEDLTIVEFLSCFVYEVTLDDGEKRTCSSEEMIDVRKYKKWNSNSGFVSGQTDHSGLDMDLHKDLHPSPGAACHVGRIQDNGAGRIGADMPGLDGCQGKDLGVIQECDDEEDINLSESSSGNESSDDEHANDASGSIMAHGATGPKQSVGPGSTRTRRLVKIKPEDVPQAFSHFSYVSSKRRMLVCDLQGVFDDSSNPRRFRFTDPVIHYHSNIMGRTHVFGKTDLGKQGMHRFFQTHRCNDLCRHLRLDRGCR